MLRVLIILPLLISCNNTALTRVCPSDCYTFNHGEAGVGVCKAGDPIYSDDDTCTLLECVGDVGPSEIYEHSCDGLDNDCDGVVDGPFEVYRSPEQIRAQGLCLTDGVCKWASVSCNGADGFACHYPQTHETTETRCDGLDNDCDGEVDDVDSVLRGEDGSFIPCYDHPHAPPESVLYGECSYGVLLCLEGDPFCTSQGPKVEKACTGLDEDCDGLVDEGATIQEKVQMVLIRDISGSAGQYLGTIESALQQYVAQFSSPLYEFALVHVSGTSPENTVSVELDFGPYTDLLAALSAQDYGSFEGTLDAVQLSCDGGLGLNWSEGSKKLLVMFADEPPQSYTQPACTEVSAADACVAIDAPVFVFSPSYHYDQICSDTGGTCYDLNNSTYMMQQNLNDVLSSFQCPI
ncbi:MAG: hypothetical protein CMF70_06930 [Magnetovibrio sp.]|nr:hypothetical protein [Magnetovibrio sp.]